MASGSGSQAGSRRDIFLKNKYQIIGENGKKVRKISDARIGGGSFGTVYRVRHTIERKNYAAKIIDKNKIKIAYGDSAVEKIYKEARNLAKLNGHPHVVEYKQVDENDSYVLIAMGLCQKNMAAHFNERKKTLSPQSIRQYLLQLAKGLEYLHSQGIVHRDLKQDNICFGPDGKLKLVDLGLATQFKGEGMKSQYMSTLFKPRGHIAYQAPESRKQNVSIDGKSDV